MERLMAHSRSGRPTIRALRRLGGTWHYERTGFGAFRYWGVINGIQYELEPVWLLTPKYDGDDESCERRWSLTVGGYHNATGLLLPCCVVSRIEQLSVLGVMEAL